MHPRPILVIIRVVAQQQGVVAAAVVAVVYISLNYHCGNHMIAGRRVNLPDPVLAAAASVLMRLGHKTCQVQGVSALSS